MTKHAFRKGAIVFDTWWPWRRGTVLRVGKTQLRVRWDDGKEWSYDKAHLQFLRPHHKEAVWDRI